MRSLFLALSVVLATLGGGCSHTPAERADGWVSRVAPENESGRETQHAAAQAPAAGTSWAPISKVRGGPWEDLVITPVSSKGPHAVAHTDGPYLLDSGDQLRVFVYGQPNLSRIYKVDHAGNVMVPLIGLVKAQRRTNYQVAGEIRARLGSEYVRDPQITVDIHENRPFFILGEVRSPGQYPYVNGMTVETAVAIAGGYTPRASTHNFRISRRVDGIIEVDKGSGDYVVQPGDTIKVTERFF
jgi:polysaccharide export outer membrane protein